jgi:CheY-like chemotaxis protein
VAKILVADDNSNIQKMVGLALKDQGIDVVAVGNGEAAVRKISDIHPDLVLADVFMPVRNGYEVCEYVKKDPALAHIPVILLVGAFDPLDEQEAQRVGADGVLKKPFVPPDPLIAMVKAALARAGVSLSKDKSAQPAKGAERKGSEIRASKAVPAPTVSVPMSVAPSAMAFEDTEGLVEEVSLKPAAVTMEGGAPLAFGNLMGTAETSEEDAAFIAPGHPERDWRAKEDEEGADVPEEDEEEGAEKTAWRRDAQEPGALAGPGSAVGNWRDTKFSEPPTRKSAREDWETPKDVPGTVEAAAHKETATSTSEAAVATNSSSEVVAAQPAAAFSEDAWAAAIAAGTNGQSGLNAEAEAAAKVWPGNDAQLVSGVSAEAQVLAHDEILVTAPGGSGGAATGAGREIEHAALSTAIDRFAVAREVQEEKSDPMASGAWEVQANKANLLAATWDAPVVNEAPTVLEPAVANAATETEGRDEPVAEEGKVAEGAERVAAVTEEASSHETVVEHFVSEAAPGEAAETSAYAAMDLVATVEELAPVVEAEPAYIAEAVQAQPAGAETESGNAELTAVVEAGADGSVEAAAGPAEDPQAESFLKAAVANAANGSLPTGNGASDAVNDEVVARVLASLSPEVLQAVTRQILKPVVEAMVRDELNKKQ